MKTEDVMTRRVVACRADTDLSHVARLMWENDCGAVPVVDADDRVVGIVTDRDLCMSAHFQGRALRELKASVCMASDVLTSRPGDDVEALAARMAGRRVRRAPVTDEHGRLLGIVSLGDLLRGAARSGDKKRKTLQSALVDALTHIVAREAREDVAPPLPSQPPTPASKAPKKNADGRKGSKKKTSKV